jgi:hypothetical protein
VLLQLGLAQAERGQISAARKLLTEAKHLDPGERRIDLALQQLAEPKQKGKRKTAA